MVAVDGFIASVFCSALFHSIRSLLHIGFNDQPVAVIQCFESKTRSPSSADVSTSPRRTTYSYIRLHVSVPRPSVSLFVVCVPEKQQCFGQKELKGEMASMISICNKRKFLAILNNLVCLFFVLFALLLSVCLPLTWWSESLGNRTEREREGVRECWKQGSWKDYKVKMNCLTRIVANLMQFGPNVVVALIWLAFKLMA